MAYDPKKHPRGKPGNAGQFRETERDDVVLDDSFEGDSYDAAFVLDQALEMSKDTGLLTHFSSVKANDDEVIVKRVGDASEVRMTPEDATRLAALIDGDDDNEKFVGERIYAEKIAGSVLMTCRSPRESARVLDGKFDVLANGGEETGVVTLPSRHRVTLNAYHLSTLADEDGKSDMVYPDAVDGRLWTVRKRGRGLGMETVSSKYASALGRKASGDIVDTRDGQLPNCVYVQCKDAGIEMEMAHAEELTDALASKDDFAMTFHDRAGYVADEYEFSRTNGGEVKVFPSVKMQRNEASGVSAYVPVIRTATFRGREAAHIRASNGDSVALYAPELKALGERAERGDVGGEFEDLETGLKYTFDGRDLARVKEA